MQSPEDNNQEKLALLEKKLEHQMVIHDFVKEVLEQDSVDNILWSICKNIISKLGLEDCVIYMIDEEREVLVQKAAYGPKNLIAKKIENPIEIPLGQGVVGTVAQTGIAEVINDTTKDARYIIDDDYRLSEITIPIVYNGKVIGVIDSENSKRDFYTDFHLQIMQTISSLCSTRIGYAIAHEKLENYKNQLELIVENRTLELNDTIEKLSISNKNLEQYAYIVSHDLKSPLHTVAAYLKLIEKIGTNLGTQAKQCIQMINDAVSRMSSLLEDILKISINNDSNKGLATLIDLNVVLDKVISNLQFEILENKVEIVKENKLPLFWGLESHFIQIFQNLISNSIKYRIREVPQKVIISSQFLETKDTVIFRDFGVGVKEEFLESIFDLGERRFFDAEGKGIGLHTCKNIIKYYNGNIKASSDGHHKGMTITIDLPKQKEG